MLAALVAVLALSSPRDTGQGGTLWSKGKEVVSRTLGPVEQQATVPDRTRVLVRGGEISWLLPRGFLSCFQSLSY